MTEVFSRLSDSDLRVLAAALRASQIGEPYSVISLKRLLSDASAVEVAEAMDDLTVRGLNAKQISMMLELILLDRKNRPRAEDKVILVTTGPEAGGITNRDTRVVVSQLFSNACNDVLLVGYAVYQGKQVFQALAKRMSEQPALRVRFCIDIKRKWQDTTSNELLISDFVRDFRLNHWPSESTMPKLYYFPESLSEDRKVRASLHAKVVVVDGSKVFVSSANFTEAAQTRNIEMGLLLESVALGGSISRHFDTLIDYGVLKSAE